VYWRLFWATLALAFLLAVPAQAEVHPYASQQPTASGREIDTLTPYNGALYAGYGDYGANTGPIAIVPYTPPEGFGTPLWANTEAIEAYRPIGGKLYAPHTDPRSGWDYSTGEPWAQFSKFASAHVYDAAETSESLWLCGSAGNNGTVWRSLDSGTTWQVALSVPPSSGRTGDFVRVNLCVAHGGALYVNATHYYGTQLASYIFADEAWSRGGQMYGYGYHGESFNGRIIYQSAVDSQLYQYPHRRIHTGVWDYTISGGRLYALGFDGTVKSKAGGGWRAEGAAPVGARSIALLNGRLYFGTTDGQIIP
jgi:hypothetical protein